MAWKQMKTTIEKEVKGTVRFSKLKHRQGASYLTIPKNVLKGWKGIRHVLLYENGKRIAIVKAKADTPGCRKLTRWKYGGGMIWVGAFPERAKLSSDTVFTVEEGKFRGNDALILTPGKEKA